MNTPDQPSLPPPSRIGRRQKISLLVALLLLLASAAVALLGPGRGAAADNAPRDFTLTSADGPLALHDFRGRKIILYFGYTTCPDACPTALGATAQALAQLTPAELAEVQPLFVSVDPERDSPAHLKTYAAFFHPSIRGMTGSPAAIATIARDFGVFYAHHDDSSAAGYTIDHTSSLYLLDRQGRLTTTLPHGASPGQIVAALRAVP